MTHAFRWGILGTAAIAETLIQAIRGSGESCIRAVASRTPARAEEWAKAHEVPLAFGSYEALLRSGEVDAVYLPLPNSLHAEWSIRSLEAGLPVLCEKPFAISAAQARTVAAVSKRVGLPVAEAFMYRFHPVYAKVREVIREGRIGRMTTILSQFTFFLDDRSAIPASAELAGGALMDVGCYCVNASRLIAGCEPSRAAAFARRTTVDDTMTGLLEFPNGILAHFETSIENHERHRLEIAGTEGSILVEKPWLPAKERAAFLVRRGEREEVVTTAGGNPYLFEVEDFSRACREGRSPRWPVEDAIANMAAIDALHRSARERRVVDVRTSG